MFCQNFGNFFLITVAFEFSIQLTKVVFCIKKCIGHALYMREGFLFSICFCKPLFCAEKYLGVKRIIFKLIHHFVRSHNQLPCLMMLKEINNPDFKFHLSTYSYFHFTTYRKYTTKENFNQEKMEFAKSAKSLGKN